MHYWEQTTNTAYLSDISDTKKSRLAYPQKTKKVAAK